MHFHFSIRSQLAAILGAVLLMVGCGESDAAGEAANALAVVSSAVSECGGFGTASGALTDSSAVAGYCDAERLTWSYDKETGVLSLLNTRVVLNCCGDHGFTTTLAENGTYIVTETDYPEKTSTGSTDRCNCMCVFDYEISLDDIPSERVSLQLLRDVKEAESVATVWQGTLDLSESSTDNVVVTNEDDASVWCGSTTE